jgi:septum formation protein
MLVNKLNGLDIVLASGSPRRYELLKDMGINFRVDVKPVNEVFNPDLSPENIAESLSELKISAFEKSYFKENTLVITADTIVVLNDEVLGKPANRNDAVEILNKLSGNRHTVITGVSLKNKHKTKTFSASTHVWFKRLSQEEIEYYIDNYRPYDKAGAYGIQEWIAHAAIEKIEGSYFNVMGLPTHKLYVELEKFLTSNNKTEL